MIENFDCTQFITFNSTETINIGDLLKEYGNIGFEIINDNEIRKVKKEYFKDYFQQSVYELKNDNFLGEFENWESVDKIPDKIYAFIKAAKMLLAVPGIINFKIILTNFAEQGTTKNEIIKVKTDDIAQGLFGMSLHNFDIWTDNLIIEIIK